MCTKIKFCGIVEIYRKKGEGKYERFETKVKE